MQSVKLSDVVVRYIESLDVRHVFIVTGGGAMHLDDSLGKSKKITYICNQHEQASAMAAEAYARLNGLGVCLVTSGPGSTNTLTGITGAWLDSIPLLMISGQVKRETIRYGKLRQLGDQEINIIDIVKPVTKYAVTIRNADNILYHLEKAVYLASHGRPGPVWIDIPLDIQASYIRTETVRHFIPPDSNKLINIKERKRLSEIVRIVIQKICSAKRPVLLAGNGIRIAGAAEGFLRLADTLKIPVLTSFAGYDLIESSHKYFFGRPSHFGQRAAAFIIQNADLVLSIGSRLNIRIVTYNYKSWARNAYVIAVDIDKAELEKKTLRIDFPIHCDAKEFIEEMNRQLKRGKPRKIISSWMAYCRNLNRKYPIVLPEYRDQKKYVNSYVFIDELSKQLNPGSVVAVSNGTALTCTYQAFTVKRNQRIILNSGCASMGYGLPAAIGACCARNYEHIVCIEGDGSIQMNIQELQTVSYYHLPIKIFIYNNQGYLAIRITQNAYFKGHLVGSDPSSGVGNPDFRMIAKAYNLPYQQISTHKTLKHHIRTILSMKGPVLCEILMSPHQTLYPKISSTTDAKGRLMSSPLEDMYPFLPREEFLRNMLIPIWNENK